MHSSPKEDQVKVVPWPHVPQDFKERLLGLLGQTGQSVEGQNPRTVPSVNSRSPFQRSTGQRDTADKQEGLARWCQERGSRRALGVDEEEGEIPNPDWWQTNTVWVMGPKKLPSGELLKAQFTCFTFWPSMEVLTSITKTKFLFRLVKFWGAKKWAKWLPET